MARRSYAKYDSYHISKMDTSYLTFFISNTGYFSFMIWRGLINHMLFGMRGLNISIAAMLLALMMRMC